jgi:hypothetical protein
MANRYPVTVSIANGKATLQELQPTDKINLGDLANIIIEGPDGHVLTIGNAGGSLTSTAIDDLIDSGNITVDSLGGVTLDEAFANTLPLTGGTMTGPLVLDTHPTSGSDPLTAATKQYVDNHKPAYIASDITSTATGNLAATNVQSALEELDNKKLAVAGGTMIGTLTLTEASQTDPDDAATRAYADLKLPLAGGTLTGKLVLEPTLQTNPNDAATRDYVDTVVAGINYHPSVVAATTGTLETITGGTATYADGTGFSPGEGATITLSVALAALDTVTLAEYDRILVKDQANKAHNGIYNISADGLTLIRAVEEDQADEFVGGDFFFVDGGALNGGTAWIQRIDVEAFGVDNIEFAQIGRPLQYNAGLGLDLTNFTFSVANTTVTTGAYGGHDSVATFTVNHQGQLTLASNAAIRSNAANLTGTTLSSTVVSSSLTSVGTLTGLGVNGQTTTVNLQVNGVSNLGPVGNVTITGGTSGQLLSTNGSGTLSWTSPGDASRIANGTSNVSVEENGNVSIGVAGTSNVVAVSATQTTITGNAVITGNLTVNGSRTLVNSNVAYIVDPMIELGGGPNNEALTTNDGKDRGVLLHRHTDTAAVDSFMGWDNSNGEFAFGSNVSESSDVITFNTLGNVRAGNGFFANVTLGADPENALQAATKQYVDNSVDDYLPLTGGNLTGVLRTGPVANVKITGGSSGQVITTDGTGNLSFATPAASGIKYTKEWHVSVQGNDTTGDGSYNKPYATFTKALSVMGNTGEVIYAHAGIYTENVTWSDLNGDLVGVHDSAVVQLQGNWTFASTSSVSSVRVRNVNFAGNLTHSGTAALYLNDLNIGNPTSSNTITKSGSGYFELHNVDTQNITAFNVTGAGQVVFDGGLPGNVVVNNTGALVTIQSSINAKNLRATAGYLAVIDSFVFSTALGTPAITSTASAQTLVFLNGARVYGPTGLIERINIPAGVGYSILNSVFDRANSTLLGVNLGNTLYSDNLTTLSGLTVGGVSTLGAVGNVRITGGSSGQVLTTNGAGALSWGAASAVGVKEYAHLTSDSTAIVDLGSIFPFNTITGTLTSPGTGVVNLKGGKTYRLTAGCSVSDGWLQSWMWVLTATNTNIGVSSFTQSGVSDSISTVSFQTAASAIYTASVDTLVCVKLVADGGVGPQPANGNNSWGYIEEIGSSAITGNVTIGGGANSTSTTTGAVIVSGGLGVSGNAYIGANLNVAGVSTLGAVGNVRITGGTAGQVLTSNGAGGLSFTSVGGGASIANGTSNVAIAAANGNVTVGVGGVANIATFKTTGANITGTLDVSGITNLASNLNVTGTSNLGAVGNVRITGGSSGQVLTTSGSGNLSWSTPATVGVKEYAHLTSDSTAIVDLGSIFPFNTITGTLTSPGTGVVNLKGGKTYRLTAGCSVSGGWLQQWQWVLTATNTNIGVPSFTQSGVSGSTSTVSFQTAASAIYTASVDTLVCVKLIADGDVGPTPANGNNSWGYIEEIGSSAITGNVTIGGGAASTSTSTGGVVVSGGLGVSGDVFATNLARKKTQIVATDVDVTLDNVKIRMPATGRQELQISTVTGTQAFSGSLTGLDANSPYGFAVSVTATTTPAYMTATGSGSFNAAGDQMVYTIMNAASNLAYRITGVPDGSGNFLITIEALV